MAKIHRVVVVGGGIAGLDLATHLPGQLSDRGRFEVTLIDREAAHIWKPMLHTIAAGTRDVHQQQTSYIAQARACEFVFHPGEVIAVDQEAKQIVLAALRAANGEALLDRREIGYDTLILAIGSLANDFGTPGVAEHCWTIDSRAQALAFNDEVRIRMLQSFARHAPLRIGIVGGGATGVELAAELIQLAQLSEYYGARDMVSKLKIFLLESGDRILAAFPGAVSEAAKARLERLGVLVQTGAHVMEVADAGFRLGDGTQRRADLKVWAAGVKAPNVLTTLQGMQLTRSHQVVVRPTLESITDKNIYAVGDCASLTFPGESRSLPPTAQVAYQQARYLGKWLPTLLAGGHAPDFRYRDFGSLISLGGCDAYGSLGKFGFFKGGFIHGRVAQLGHAMLYRSHQARLYGFWRGTLLWAADQINARILPSIRLD